MAAFEWDAPQVTPMTCDMIVQTCALGCTRGVADSTYCATCKHGSQYDWLHIRPVIVSRSMDETVGKAVPTMRRAKVRIEKNHRAVRGVHFCVSRILEYTLQIMARKRTKYFITRSIMGLIGHDNCPVDSVHGACTP